MINFIKNRLRTLINEADLRPFKPMKHKVLPYEEKPEARAHNKRLGSQDKSVVNSDKVLDELNKAKSVATHYAVEYPNDNYFMDAEDGNGTFKLTVYKNNGKMIGGQTVATGSMPNTQGKGRVSDIGTCTDTDKAIMYCFVNAGKPFPPRENRDNWNSYGSSPAWDASEKAKFYFRDEILAFLSASLGHNDGEGADTAEKNSTDKGIRTQRLKDFQNWSNPDRSPNQKGGGGYSPTKFAAWEKAGFPDLDTFDKENPDLNLRPKKDTDSSVSQELKNKWKEERAKKAEKNREANLRKKYG